MGRGLGRQHDDNSQVQAGVLVSIKQESGQVNIVHQRTGNCLFGSQEAGDKTQTPFWSEDTTSAISTCRLMRALGILEDLMVVEVLGIL